MKIKYWKVRESLKKRGISLEEFAEALDVSMEEAGYMTTHRCWLDVNTARRFINFFGARTALQLIDFSHKTKLKKQAYLAVYGPRRGEEALL